MQENLDFCFQLVIKSSVAFYCSRGDVGMAKKVDSEILRGDINTSLINFCKSSEILLPDRIPLFQLVMYLVLSFQKCNMKYMTKYY